MTESPPQKVIREAVEQAARDAHERRLEETVKIQSALYDKASAYTNLVLAAGYAGFFAVWGSMRSDLTRAEALTAALCMTVSLVVFILWQIFTMLYLSKGQRDMAMLVELPQQAFDKRLGELTVAAARMNVRLSRYWFAVLLFTIAPAGVAVTALLRGFARQLAALI